MDTEALESLLNGAEETDSLEFKGAMAWNHNSLVKDILAMANIIDGGRIIVGVADGTFERQGLSDEQIASFNIDIMRDQVAPFADPHVVFRLEVVADREGRRYALIEVYPFGSIPVICKTNGHDVQAGSIYFRSRTRRPQSARVDNSSDMREIIELSTARTMRRLQRLGFATNDDEEDVGGYNAELGDL